MVDWALTLQSTQIQFYAFVVMLKYLTTKASLLVRAEVLLNMVKTGTKMYQQAVNKRYCVWSVALGHNNQVWCDEPLGLGASI